MAKKNSKQKESLSLEKEYKKSWIHIKKSKNFIWAVIAIFLVSAFSAVLFPTPDQVSQQINQFMKEIVEKTKGMSASELSGFIFWNNFKASFMGVALGLIIGIFPVIFAISNGYIIGFVANMSVKEEGVLSLWRLLPHGIFELPAVFISFALGLRLGSKFINEYFGDERAIIKASYVLLFVFAVSAILGLAYPSSMLLTSLIGLILFGTLTYFFFKKEKLRKEALKAGKTFLLIIVPLLVIAAIIEGILIFLGR